MPGNHDACSGTFESEHDVSLQTMLSAFALQNDTFSDTNFKRCFQRSLCRAILFPILAIVFRTVLVAQQTKYPWFVFSMQPMACHR